MPNFGLLQPIQQVAQPMQGSAPGASAPAIRQTDPLQDLSSGFLNAYQQGQQIQQNDQAMERGEQQLKIGDQVLQQETLKTDEAKTQAEIAKATRDAATKGVEGLLQYYDSHDPVNGAVFRKQLSEQQQTEANAQKADAEAYGSSIKVRGDFVGIVNQGRNDEEKAQIWQIQRSGMPDSVKKLVPEKYTPQAEQAMMSILSFAHADYMLKNPKDNQTAAQKDLQRLATLQTKSNLSPQEQIELEGLQGREAAAARGNVLPANKVSDKLLEIDLKKVEEFDTKATEAADNLSLADNFLELNNRTNSGLFAETKLSLAQGMEALTGKKIAGTAAGEALRSSGMDFVFKRIKDTKGAISEREMDAFERASPGLRNSKAGNTLILNMYKAKEQRIMDRARLQREYIEKNSSLKGFDKVWKDHIEQNPIDPKTFSIVTKDSKKSDAVQQAPQYSQDAIQAEMKRRGLL